MKARKAKPTIGEQLEASAVFRAAIDELAADDEAARADYSRRGVVVDLSRSPVVVRVFSLG